ncbi:hypothetical protein C8J56DRAFT_919522 [Mycena floridula]|nr:hypothetical protein C8J56DRAFT_919522 [Mycena floridula]
MSRWSPIRSLLALSPILVVSPWFAWWYHTQGALPTPLSDLIDPVTLRPQISEAAILNTSKHLSEGIGYRTVGTQEHALADYWVWEQVQELCKNARDGLQCEVWRQQASGAHRFDIMKTRIYKSYTDLTNIIVRVSNGTEGQEHAVLVNSHLDSTLPSPGAADDALSVGVMLDCIRVLTQTPEWSPQHAIIFLFNNAEESLQDASHLFSTQHPLAASVRAVINLEAAGTTGREVLFQATSEQMIQAYSKVPHPFGTIFASDIFRANVIQSDTDFSQFQRYLNITGLDMAVIGNGFLYHMRKDLVENIQQGVAQNMGENTLALLLHMTSSASPLPSLTQGYTTPTTVFFSLFTSFFVYSFTTAKIIYGGMFLATVLIMKVSMRELALGVSANILGFTGALIFPNIVALIMTQVLGKGMSWFSGEILPVILYGPPAILGALSAQLLFSPLPESAAYSSMLFLQTLLALIVQLCGIGSAALLFVTGIPLFVALVLNRLMSPMGGVALWSYALGLTFNLLTGTLIGFPILEVFVPLMGRVGQEAPADNAIASIVSALGSLLFPLVIPFAHRFRRAALKRGIFALTVLVALEIAIFAQMSVFDADHQRRVFVFRLENITSKEHNLHIAYADAAPGFDLILNQIPAAFGENGQKLEAENMSDYNPNYEPLYPFSRVISGYQMPLAVDAAYISPSSTKFSVVAVQDAVDLSHGTRKITLDISHPGLIWTVLAFDAHVLEWSLDNNPPDVHTRHHIKEASFFGSDLYSISMTIKVDPKQPSLFINFMGIREDMMWPAKKSLFGTKEGRALTLFSEMDAWFEQQTKGSLDVTFMGAVAGSVSI